MLKFVFPADNKDKEKNLLATCYICGKSGADYRRTVHTGVSHGTHFSSRGRVSYSTRSYYGKRCVCSECAFKIDYKEIKNKYNQWWIIVALPLSMAIAGSISDRADWTGVAWVATVITGVIAALMSMTGKEKAEKWAKNNYYNYFPEQAPQKPAYNQIDFSKVNELADYTEKVIEICFGENGIFNCCVEVLKNECEIINEYFSFDADKKEESLRIFERKYGQFAFSLVFIHTMPILICSHLENVEKRWQELLSEYPQDDRIKEIANTFFDDKQKRLNSVLDFVEKNSVKMENEADKITTILKSDDNFAYILNEVPLFLSAYGLNTDYKPIIDNKNFNPFDEKTWCYASSEKPVKIKGDRISFAENPQEFMTEKDFVKTLTEKNIKNDDIRLFSILEEINLMWAKYAEPKDVG